MEKKIQTEKMPLNNKVKIKLNKIDLIAFLISFYGYDESYARETAESVHDKVGTAVEYIRLENKDCYHVRFHKSRSLIIPKQFLKVV